APRPRRGPDRGIAQVAGGGVRRTLPAYPPQLPGRPLRTGRSAARARRPRARDPAPRPAAAGRQPPLRGGAEGGCPAAVGVPEMSLQATEAALEGRGQGLGARDWEKQIPMPPLERGKSEKLSPVPPAPSRPRAIMTT